MPMALRISEALGAEASHRSQRGVSVGQAERLASGQRLALGLGLRTPTRSNNGAVPVAVADSSSNNNNSDTNHNTIPCSTTFDQQAARRLHNARPR